VVLAQPGDSVILNAATSSVGQCLLQLCKLLKLRGIAVINAPAAGQQLHHERTVEWLRSLGAVEVLVDDGSLKVRTS
jgi:mitochondrial enoyl-[acyl-carrier protein] reductase / trans-2-enoyl-CoA reductase